MLLRAYEEFNISCTDPIPTYTSGPDPRQLLGVGFCMCDIPWEAGRYNLYFMFSPLRSENTELGDLAL